MYTVTRQIGIDAGHRVPTHGSKCANLHGHRYEVYATCSAMELLEAGVQSGMVVDFGFLKEEMMRVIDTPSDHAMILWRDDSLLHLFLAYEQRRLILDAMSVMGSMAGYLCNSPDLPEGVRKLYIVPFIPTAENLAEHWFHLLSPLVHVRSEGYATLMDVTVYETPNCSATYAPGKTDG